MRKGLGPWDDVRLYDPGYDDGEAYIDIPRSMLAAMGVEEGRPLLAWVSDEDAGRVEILGQAGEEDATNPYTFMARPQLGGDPDYSPRYSFSFPREWKEKHFRQDDEDLNDWGDDPFEPIEVDHTLESARSMVRGDHTLIVPFRR